MPAHRALIVEDDPAIRRLVEKLLTRQNIVTDAAEDGLVALDKLKKNDYSVIVLDLMVPELNGFEVIEFLKTRESRTPVAVVSAVSQQALTRLDLDIVKLVISKPFDVDEFTRAIVTLCAESRGSQEN
jgi:DNA-binding response OmpR family regulator